LGWSFYFGDVVLEIFVLFLRVMATFVAVFSLSAPEMAIAQAAKPVVAVSGIEDLSGSDLAPQLTAMIQTAVAGTGKFRIMERTGMDQLVAEQSRARSGLVTTNTPNRRGGFEGVDFLIYGTITSVNVRTESNIGGDMLRSVLTGNQSSGCVNKVASMELDIRITDAVSGEIRYVKRLNELARAQTACNGGSNSVDTGVLLRGASDKIAAGLVTSIYPIQIASVQPDGQLVLNYGEGTLAVGQSLNVFSRGEQIKDPATGEVIGSTESKLGMVRVTEVMGRLSRATPVEAFAVSPAIGSILRVASEDEARASARPRRR
jgi:curli biogenesis system outer membrane secretion channel CsgG